MSLPITLRVITPEGVKKELECDDVVLYARDNAKGEGGGSVGIHKGHIPAVIALENGATFYAKAEGEEIYRAKAFGGFAKVKDNEVTVIAPSVSEED